ncbi:MAG: transporter [Sphingomonas sp.]|nr:transporter [Sphingomonas sp.]
MMSVPATAGKMADPICADRPGKGSATCTTPAGHFQFETGLADWSLTKSSGTRKSDLKLGETSVKYGVNDRLHFEVSFKPLVRQTSRSSAGHSTTSGFGDTTVKLKQQLTADGATFSAALYPYVKIPTASKRIGNGKVEVGVVVPLGLALGASAWSLSASPEIDLAADGDGPGYHAAMAQTLSLGFQATSALNLSVELWGAWDWDPSGITRQASVDGSAAYTLGSEWQFDAGANFGLNRDTADVEVFGGMSMRF